MTDYTTKDSGKRQEFSSGMVRDTNEGKPRFDLLVAPGVPYENQVLTRWASLMARGAKKYGDHNWTKANSQEELNRFKESAFRHFMAWIAGDESEDHMAGTMYNLMAHESIKYKINNLTE